MNRGRKAKAQGRDTVIVQGYAIDSRTVNGIILTNPCHKLLFIVDLREVIANDIGAQMHF